MRATYIQTPFDLMSVICEQVDTVIASNQGLRHVLFDKAASRLTFCHQMTSLASLWVDFGSSAQSICSMEFSPSLGSMSLGFFRD
jgi:hypothetical protein